MGTVQRLSPDAVTRALQSLPLESYGGRFTFIIGEDELMTRSFVADLISPMIARIHRQDPTVESYNIQCTASCDILSAFIQLSQGIALTLRTNDIPAFLDLASELKNSEIYVALSPDFEGPISLTNSVARLQQLKAFALDYGEVIQFISAHFYEFERRDDLQSIDELDTIDVESILSHDSVQLWSDDSLYRLISRRFDRDSEAFRLLPFVNFRRLAAESKAHLTEAIPRFIDTTDQAAWSRICVRLLGAAGEPLEEIDDSRRYFLGQLFAYNEERPLTGIIAHLTQIGNGNVHDREIVTVDSNNTHGSHLPRNAADLDDRTNYFHAANDTNIWLRYDFKNRKVRATGYTIRTRPDADANVCHLRNWVVEGSNDGSDGSWKVLDEHRECGDLNTGRNAQKSYQIAKPQTFQMIRIRSFGVAWRTAWDSPYYWTVGAFELFGHLIE
jgi:hypothetical protein